MEKQGQQTPEDKEPKNLEEVFMELFTPEFLESLPTGHIETVINNLEMVESIFETIPPQWSALRNVLRERGFLE